MRGSSRAEARAQLAPDPLVRRVEASEEVPPRAHLLVVQPPLELVVVELLDLLVDPRPLAVRPRHVVVARHEAKAPTLEPELADERLEEALGLLELLLARGLGDVAGDDDEIDRREAGVVEGRACLREERATERRRILPGEARVRTEVQIREVQDHQHCDGYSPCARRTKPGLESPGFGAQRARGEFLRELGRKISPACSARPRAGAPAETCHEGEPAWGRCARWCGWWRGGRVG